MEESPLGYALAKTSTPRYSFEDSGYCGADEKSNPRNHFQKLSPVSESPRCAFELPRLLDISEFSPLKSNHANTTHPKFTVPSLHDNSINKQLRFDDSGIASESLSSENECAISVQPSNSLYEYFRPSYHSDISSQEDCKSKQFLPSIIKLSPKVDFLTVMKRRRCQHIITDLLSYLPAEDLCRMNCVSKTWKELILKDVKANGRRREYLKKMKAQRENQLRSQLAQFDLKKRYERLSQLPNMILKDINKSSPDTKSKLTGGYNSKFESFVTAGKSQFDGLLMKCPRCSYAAKMINVQKYICTDCYYVFCKKCLFPCENAHSCPVSNNVKRIDIIGSKKSKKNLRRL